MSSRQGGKLKPLKAPKKKVEDEETEEEKAHKKKMKADQALLKEAQDKAKSKGGPLIGGGIKKSGKK